MSDSSESESDSFEFDWWYEDIEMLIINNWFLLEILIDFLEL